MPCSQDLRKAVSSKDELSSFIKAHDEAGGEYTLNPSEQSALFAAFDVAGLPEACALSLERFYPKKNTGSHKGAHIRLGVFRIDASPSAPLRAVERRNVVYEQGGIVMDTTRGQPKIDHFFQLCAEKGFEAARAWTKNTRMAKPKASEGLVRVGQLVGIAKKSKKPPAISPITAAHVMLNLGSPSKAGSDDDGEAIMPASDAAAGPPTASLPSSPLPLPLPHLLAAEQAVAAPAKEPTSVNMVHKLSDFVCEHLKQPTHLGHARAVLKILLAWHAFGLFYVFKRVGDEKKRSVCHAGLKDAVDLPGHIQGCIDAIPQAAAGSSNWVLRTIRVAIQAAFSLSGVEVKNARDSLDKILSDGNIILHEIECKGAHMLDPRVADDCKSRHVKGLDPGTLILRHFQDSFVNYTVVYSVDAVHVFETEECDMPVSVTTACIYSLRIMQENILCGTIASTGSIITDEYRRLRAKESQYLTPCTLPMLMASCTYHELVAHDPSMPAMLAAVDAVRNTLNYATTNFVILGEASVYLTAFHIVVDGEEEWLACRFSVHPDKILFTCFDTSPHRDKTSQYAEQPSDQRESHTATATDPRFMQIYMAATLLSVQFADENTPLQVRIDASVPVCPTPRSSGIVAVSVLAKMMLDAFIAKEFCDKDGVAVLRQYRSNVVQHLIPSNWHALAWK